MDDGALIDGVVRIDDLRSRKAKKGVDGNEDDADGIIMNGTSPLKVMVCSEREGRTNEPFPKRREGLVVGLMD